MEKKLSLSGGSRRRRINAKYSVDMDARMRLVDEVSWNSYIAKVQARCQMSLVAITCQSWILVPLSHSINILFLESLACHRVLGVHTVVGGCHDGL